MYEKGLISREVTERSPTGWLSDHATECLSLGVGIQNNLRRDSVLLDTYWNSKDTYNPCAGLIDLSLGKTESIDSAGYARYWHGHAILIQWLILLIGLPILKNIMWILTFGILAQIIKEIYKFSEIKFNYKIVIATIFPFVAFSDLADLHTSITHSLAAIFTLATIYFLIKLYKFTIYASIFSGFVLGSLYAFILYGLSPQTVPVAIFSFGGILLLISKKNSKEVASKVISFTLYWIIGYIITFVSKWFFVAIFTDYDILTEAKKQLVHRSSQSVTSLSDGVLQHLEFAQNFPAFIQSWIANISTLMVHLLDPRYAASLLFYLVCTALISCVFYIFFTFLHNLSIIDITVKLCLFFNLFSFLLLFSWYALLAQHSFDHATYTYRSLVFLVGGVLGTFYLLKSKAK